jgi:hypothetical protein
MKKYQAIEMLGGSVTSTAKAIGITPSAVTQWPEDLPPRIVDRVYAADARIKATSPKRRKPAPATVGA